ncbi:hypothetical protein FRC08_000530 [Ceratobasidium sp. 394]|nr:hypothetical protein FRC08_000530 [Ceratobasidium sp. 394]
MPEIRRSGELAERRMSPDAKRQREYKIPAPASSSPLNHPPSTIFAFPFTVSAHYAPASRTTCSSIRTLPLLCLLPNARYPVFGLLDMPPHHDRIPVHDVAPSWRPYLLWPRTRLLSLAQDGAAWQPLGVLDTLCSAPRKRS